MHNSSDHLEIRALPARVTHLSDEGSVDDYGLVYAENAVSIIRDATKVGLPAITEASRRWYRPSRSQD